MLSKLGHPEPKAGWAVDKGRKRDRNEDSVAAVAVNLMDGDCQQTMGIYAVADGVGGAAYGEIASRTAVEIVIRQLTQRIIEAQPNAVESYQDWLKSAVRAANTRIYDAPKTMGTTLVTAMVLGTTAYIANVGDSRAYLLTTSSIRQITEDQSMVQVLYNTGIINAGQRADHPYRNVLYQAVGTTEAVRPDIYTIEADDENYLLLCSDGLTNELDDEAIYTIVMQVESPQAACDRLVEQANQHGGHDNISVLIVTL